MCMMLRQVKGYTGLYLFIAVQGLLGVMKIFYLQNEYKMARVLLNQQGICVYLFT